MIETEDHAVVLLDAGLADDHRQARSLEHDVVVIAIQQFRHIAGDQRLQETLRQLLHRGS